MPLGPTRSSPGVRGWLRSRRTSLFCCARAKSSAPKRERGGRGAYALLLPGSGGGPSCPKRWTAAGWIALAAKLAEQGVRPLLAGTEAEAALIAEIAGASTGGASTAVNLAGKTNLAELYTLAAGAACVISCDSGAGHLAAAAALASARARGEASTPVLTLFSAATGPDRWLPPGGNSLAPHPACRTGGRRGLRCP